MAPGNFGETKGRGDTSLSNAKAPVPLTDMNDDTPIPPAKAVHDAPACAAFDLSLVEGDGPYPVTCDFCGTVTTTLDGRAEECDMWACAKCAEHFDYMDYLSMPDV